VDRVRFWQLPTVLQVVFGLALINAWVSFEEFFVDRIGLWKYMPGYRVAQFCVWDAVVVTGVVVGVTWASAKKNRARPS
jgi:hypothetical protein